MARGMQGAVLRLLGAKDHRVEVLETERLTAELIRIRFAARSLLDVLELTPTAWVRFWFPDPAGGPQEYQRAYSLFAGDVDAGWCDVIFLLHDVHGPGSTWASRAAVGDVLPVQVLGSTSFERDAESEGLVVIGDLSSLPAIATMVSSLVGPLDLHLLLEDCADEALRALGVEDPSLTVTHVRREGPASLAQALASSAIPLDHRQVWAAGESASLKALRRVVRDRAGATRSNTQVLAYWIEGRSMGKERRENG